MAVVLEYFVSRPDLTVILILCLLSAMLVVFGAVITLWIRPKIIFLEEINSRIVRIETKHESLPNINELVALAHRLDGALQGENSARNAIIEDTISRLEALHKRSQHELKRMVEAKEVTWAIEQAGQDVQLAQSMEFFSRLAGSDRHEAAKERLSRAQRKLEELEQFHRNVSDPSLDEA